MMIFPFLSLLGLDRACKQSRDSCPLGEIKFQWVGCLLADGLIEGQVRKLPVSGQNNELYLAGDGRTPGDSGGSRS